MLQRPVESGQYTSDAFAAACRRHGIRRSMGRVGSSYDNAMAESFFASIKRELLHTERWRQTSEARMAVFSWLAWYNNRRRHSALGHIGPVGPSWPRAELPRRAGHGHPQGLAPPTQTRPLQHQLNPDVVKAALALTATRQPEVGKSSRAAHTGTVGHSPKTPRHWRVELDHHTNDEGLHHLTSPGQHDCTPGTTGKNRRTGALQPSPEA